MWKRVQYILCCVLWMTMVEIQAATMRGRKSAFEKIELVNSRYSLYNDSGRFYQIDMKIPWRRHPISHQGNSSQGAAIRGDENNLWENGIIPYKLAYSIRKTTQTHKILMGAMREWEKKTCIKFVERINQPDYVEFYYGDGCNSDVGRVGGRQTTSLGRGCAHHGIIVHELGHVIGFWHEQNRPDRDKHVEIMWDNIIPKFQFAFSKYSSRKINSLNVPYDYYSVMHYGSKAFSKNHKPTIRSLKQDVTEFGNTHISPLDAKQANLLYNCPDYPKFPSDFFWTNDGPGNSDSSCVNFNEPQDPHEWHDNYLCFRKDRKALNIRWSHTGPLIDMNCIKIEVPTKNRRYSWDDNYLCWPRDGVYTFSWLTRLPSPTEMGHCLNITEPNDPEWSRNQYYLCASRDESPVDGQWSEWAPWSQCSRQCGGGIQRRIRACNSPPPSYGGRFCTGQSLQTGRCNLQQCEDWPAFPSDFSFGRFKYPPHDELCIRTYERMDYFTWNDYLFCTPTNKRDLQFQWSDRGRIPDQICARIYVPKEATKRKGTWDNNFLCMPKSDAPYRFRFSYSGPIPGLDCMQWYAKGGRDGWDKTYLCAERTYSVGNLLPSISVARPVHGRWSLWSTWSSCSQTCGGGVQRRRRFCNNPRPLNGGRNCLGRNVDERACNIERCPMACGGQLVADGGRFTSPDYPRNYPDNSVCEWVIKVPQGKVISLRFIYIDIEGPACRYDYVIVRDGPTEKYPRMGKFCGTKLPRTIQSSGNHLWVKFKSDDRTNHKGFDITWLAEPDPVISAAPVPRCGGLVTKGHGTLSSPVLSTAYQSSVDCTWVIKGDKGKQLHLWLDQFDIHSNCMLDYVEIKDGQGENSPSMGTFCGNRAPAPFKSNSNSVRIKLHISSKRRRRPKFRVRWRSVDKIRIRTTSTPARDNCPDGWVSHSFGANKVYCYLVKRNYHTWFEARRDCIQSNADLLSVMSKEEENFIIKDLNKSFKLGESFMWIGLNDHNREGQWAWSDRTQNSYLNWAPGDPNDGGYLKNEDCGVLKPDGQWNDYPCNSRFRYICKARAPRREIPPSSRRE